MDRRTSLGLRFDGKDSLHEFQSLLHAIETKPSTFPCPFAVKASAGVAHRKMNFVGRTPQSHAEPLYAAVIHAVVQGFL